MLHLAICQQHLEQGFLFLFLPLDRLIDMMKQDQKSTSLLELEVFDAIQKGQYKKLALYLRHNYNINVISKDGRNGLFYALDIPQAYRRCRMIRYCLDHGMNPLQRETTNGYTVLQETIARQQIDSFELLLAEVTGEIDWRAFDNQGRTILHQAVEANNATILEHLLAILNRYSISVDIPDKNGLTPYLLARKLHLLEMADILVKKGHASRLKSDLQTHRSAREWESIGLRENHSLLRKKLRDEINTAMRNGKINKVHSLRKIYDPLSSFSMTEKQRRDSYITLTTRSGANTTSTMSLNEMVDKLSANSEKFSPFIPTRTDQQISHVGHLPPLNTHRRYGLNGSFNSLVDLFQIAQISS